MTRFVRNVIVVILFVCCFHFSVLALTNEEVFSQFQFNFITPGARATAMGGAFIGLADDATAAATNPAGLTALVAPEVSAEFKYITYTTEQFFENPSPDTNMRRMEFDDSVSSFPFVSVVYPHKRFVFSLYRQELVNYESSYRTSASPIFYPVVDGYLYPVDASVDLTVTNYGIGAAVQILESLSLAISPRWSTMAMQSHSARFKANMTGILNL
jgi:long-chain fatty acid transport protein